MKTKFIFSLLLVVGLTSCEKTDFDDPLTLTNAEAAAQIKDLGLRLTNSAVQDAMFIPSYYTGGVFINCWADQITTTNGTGRWWDASEEPRMQYSNSQSYGAYGGMDIFYSYLYQANLDATTVTDIIVKQNKTVISTTGVDRTKDCLAAAYFAKGVSQGYLGSIFDRGIIVDELGLSKREFDASYKQLIENGVAQLDLAIAAANSNSNWNFDFIPGNTISKAQFIQICNSFAARFLASIPRSKAEAAALGNTFWNRVHTYAAAGMSTDFTTVYVTDGVGNYTQAYGFYHLGSGSDYLPVDIKLAYMADNTGTYPNKYPTTNAVLGPVTTNDARFNQYFYYTTDFGFLNPSRNRKLFSNYGRLRWDNADNWLFEPGAVSPWILAEEMRFLKAEAKMWTGDYAAAAALLNDASARRRSVGTLPGNIASTEAALRTTLHYEYSIEIDLAGGSTNPWAFMRRNDLLQSGTPTEVPIPAGQLDLLLIPNYTFGGKADAGKLGKFGEVATASLTSGWKASE
jgi:hypothetical protein